MIYEYDVVTLPLSEEQKQILPMGITNIEQLNVLIKNTINNKAADGWEPLYPFSVPQIWFRRVIIKKTKKKLT